MHPEVAGGGRHVVQLALTVYISYLVKTSLTTAGWLARTATHRGTAPQAKLAAPTHRRSACTTNR